MLYTQLQIAFFLQCLYSSKLPNSTSVALWLPIYKHIPICQKERWNSQGFYQNSIMLTEDELHVLKK